MLPDIPLHALVVVQSDTSPADLTGLPSYEITSPSLIARELWGGARRPELDGIVTDELRRRMILKLSLGERMILWDQNLDPDDRRYLARIARAGGAQVIYLIDAARTPRPEDGDGFAHRVTRFDRLHGPRTVGPIGADRLAALSGRFAGITVVGDVHGNADALRAVTEWARSRNHFVYLLGDVLDYGAEPLAAIDLAYRLVMAGTGGMIIGNHERKIAHWFNQQVEGDGRAVKLSAGNRVTTDALNRLATDQRGRWFGRFRALLARASLIEHLGPLTLVHGAIHPDSWRTGQGDPADIEQYALFGEAELVRESPAGKRQYRSRYTWVDEVPEGKLVIVGHDQRAQVPLAVRGASGGNVVFLDTGSGKGGALSSADLRFTAKGSLRLENFNRHDG